MKHNTTDSKPAATTNDQPKKSPAIIELTDDDLETVVGAARCPPGPKPNIVFDPED